MSGKKSRKRIVPQNEDLIRMDLEGLNSATVYDNDDDDGDDDFKPSKTLKHDDDNDQDIGDENSDDDENETSDDGDDDEDDDSDSNGDSEVDSEEESDEDSEDGMSDESDYDCDGNKNTSEFKENPDEVDSVHADYIHQGTSSKKNNSALKPSSSNSNMEQKHDTDCPICLLEFDDQLIGQPENCRHLFCLDCIKEWSKNVNSCPVDRQKFNVIWIKKDACGPTIEELFVEDACPAMEEVEEPPTYCQICNQCDREDVLLLCDGCDEGYHLDCLTPQLSHVPIDDWHCPKCARERQCTPTHAVASVPQRSTRTTRRRGARTVAETATFARAARAWFSGEVDANLSTFIGYRPRAARRRSYSRKGKRKTRKKSKRKTKQDGNECKQGAKIAGTKKRKRRTARKKKSSTSKRSSVKGKENKNVKEEVRTRLSMLGSATLEPTLSFSLFGNKYDLDVLSEKPEEKCQEEEQMEKKTVSNNPHILTEIFQGFEKLDSQNVVINRDGSLVPKVKKRDDAHDTKVDRNGEQDCEGRRQCKTENEDEHTVDIKHQSSKIPKLVVSGSNGVRNHSNTRMVSDSKEKDGSGVRNGLHRDSGLKRPSLDEVNNWRNLIDRKEYKPLPDVSMFKSFKIPKIVRKEDSGVKCSKEEARKSPAERKKFDSGVDRKFNRNRDFTSFDRSGERRDALRDKEKDHGEEGIGRRNSEGFVDKFNGRQYHKVPNRLTPRIYNSVPPVNNEKMMERKASDQRREVRRNSSDYASEVNSSNAARGWSLVNSRTQGTVNERLVQNDKIAKSGYVKEASNTRSSMGTIETQRGMYNYSRLNRGRTDTHDTRLAHYSTDESRVIKEKRSSVVKKIVELDSDDDESASDFTYETSLLDTKRCEQGGQYVNKKSSERRELVPVDEKKVLLETSPEYQWDFDSHDFLSDFSCGKPFQQFSPHRPDTISKDSVNEKNLSSQFRDTAGTEVISHFHEADELKILKKKKVTERLKRRELAASEAKNALKPHYRNGNISKEEYKFILKRSVTKIVASHSTINSERVARLIVKYICKLKGIKL